MLWGRKPTLTVLPHEPPPKGSLISAGPHEAQLAEYAIPNLAEHFPESNFLVLLGTTPQVQFLGEHQDVCSADLLVSVLFPPICEERTPDVGFNIGFLIKFRKIAKESMNLCNLKNATHCSRPILKHAQAAGTGGAPGSEREKSE